MSRKYQRNNDFARFEMSRDIYDRNWFNYTLIYREHQKPVNTSLNRMTFRGDDGYDPNSDLQYREYKIIKINKLGTLVEKKSFVHAYAQEEDQYLYFSHGYNQMIELNLLKIVKQGGEVKLSQRRGNYYLHKWDEDSRNYTPLKHLNS